MVTRATPVLYRPMLCGRRQRLPTRVILRPGGRYAPHRAVFIPLLRMVASPVPGRQPQQSGITGLEPQRLPRLLPAALPRSALLRA
jgi:hypothetical protein